MNNKTITIDQITVPIADERNILELCRKAGVDLPTFCYHSEISIYGACRMCMVDVDGKGILPACSTKPEDGMKVHTNSKLIREMRKMVVELMLANHDHSCFTCSKSEECRLQSISKQLGVNEVRFKKTEEYDEVDTTSKAVRHDPGKCVLCGNCVRVCDEIQSVGALGFSNRGAKTRVGASFKKGLGDMECVGCGQCAKVCPVGALTPNHQIECVMNALYDKSKTVVVQIAPAVRVSLGEYFGNTAGTPVIGKLVSALKRIGFNKVFDTCFGADLTVIEEAKEFLSRKEKGEKLPIFTSCCPSWVQFAEQYFADLLPNLSSCKSPAQMLGSLAKEKLPAELKIKREDLVMVSVMPCTSKKSEAARSELSVDGNPDIDYVITTGELANMIKEAGISFDEIEASDFDQPFATASGGGVIFGSSGGVTEAVLRFAADSMEKGVNHEFVEVRGLDEIKIKEVKVGKDTLKLGVVSGLKNARDLAEKVRAGQIDLDIIEVMACPGGCINGGGQPIVDKRIAVKKRSDGLYKDGKSQKAQVSSANSDINKLYSEYLTGHKAHDLLHTSFNSKERIIQEDFSLREPVENADIKIKVCLGTSCFQSGAQKLFTDLTAYINESNLSDRVEFNANFCNKLCTKGPVLEINGTTYEKCTIEMAKEAVKKLVK